MPSGESRAGTPTPLGLAQAVKALLRPVEVFARVEDVPAYGWSLVVLLTALTMIGYASIQTGLLDQALELRVEEGIAALEKEQFDVVERSALIKMIEEKRKEGTFLKLIVRVMHVAAPAAGTLCTILLSSAFFYTVVALTGRKPEWHSLLTIGVFASFSDLVGALVRLGFQLQLGTLAVDTSLAALGRLLLPEGQTSGAPTMFLAAVLSAVDPFRVWFWVLLAVGLRVTSQLRGWQAWACCSACWLVSVLVRAGLAVASMPRAAAA